MMTRMRCLGEDDVALVDAADRGMQHAHRDLVGAELLERAGDRLERALHVGFDDDRSSLAVARCDLGEHLLERAARAGDRVLLAPQALAVSRRCRAPGLRSSATMKSSPASGVPVKAQHLDRHRRRRPLRYSCRDRRSGRARGPIRCRRRRCRRPSSVPRLISTVATGPRPRSSFASMTRLRRADAGLALRSRSSACSRIASSSLSRLVFFIAETSTSSTSPPSSSTTISCCSSSCRTLLGIGARLVDLVDRDDDRRARRFGMARCASTVCSLMPSSAATTSTTMSVTCAPRARIAVKA